MQKIKGLLSYFKDRIWNVRLEDRNPWSAFLFKQLRIVLIVSKNFTQNKLQVQSAGLTYYTMLSVVPVVALVFAIAKGFGIQNALEDQLRTSLRGHQEVADNIMTFANRMLESTQGGLLAVVGISILLWTVMTLLSNIETTFNDIWNVAKGRSWIRKFTEYLSIMLVAPILILLSGSIQVVLTAGFENLVAGFDVLSVIGPVIFFFIRMIPYVLIWLLFTFVYMVIPNTKVKFGSALIAGIIAGTFFLLVQWVYINFQVGVSRYNAIYGSFAALPLFMIWANMSWLITLIGAEVAFANQNVEEIEKEVKGDRLSATQMHVLAMMICKRIATSFDSGETPLSAKDLSAQLKIPFGLTSKVLEVLVDSKLLTEVDEYDGDTQAFLPMKNFDMLRLHDIIEAINGLNHSEIPSMSDKASAAYFLLYEEYIKAIKNNETNKLVTDLPHIAHQKEA